MGKKCYRWLLLLAAVLLLAGCGSRTGGQPSGNRRSGTEGAENQSGAEGGKTGGALLKAGDNELPADGIITQEQLEGIAGTDAVYTFSGTDGDTGILYTWSYEGKKIQNPVEQKLLVAFPQREVEQVKEAAGKASEGLGFTLEQMRLAAPATLSLSLDRVWDVDAVIVCKWLDGKAMKICDAIISAGEAGTCLTFPILETGDTYYLVGGKTGEGLKDAQAGENSANAGSGGTGHTCTLSIECGTILNNWGDLKEEKADFVPADGWILYASEVEYEPGETVYDLLYRVCRDTGIHMEASWTPMYGSYYVEGINQLYEFDCGNLSGWMYRVNGWYPNYGCSSYSISDGDVIEWRYTCDLGRDVGAGDVHDW